MKQDDLAATFIFIFNRCVFDKEGCCKLTIEVSPQDAPKMAALAMHTQTRFKADVFVDAEK